LLILLLLVLLLLLLLILLLRRDYRPLELNLSTSPIHHGALSTVDATSMIHPTSI
jgi:hypothetical protein